MSNNLFYKIISIIGTLGIVVLSVTQVSTTFKKGNNAEDQLNLNEVREAEGVYLILKSVGYNDNGLSVIAIPMSSIESCEIAGLKLISSNRFDPPFVKKDAFECIVK